jgi:hypothetical protein
MPTATITFHQIAQTSQAILPNEPTQEHLIGDASFTLEYGGETYRDMRVAFRHPFGTNYESDPIEAEKPTGSYQGNWNHNAFRDALEDYYRGAFGRAFKIGPGAGMIMGDNSFVRDKSYTIDIP